MGGKLHPIGLIMGLAGAALTGYALFTILASAGCMAGIKGGACPAPGVSPLLVLPLGIVLAVIGMVMAGGMIVFAALFLAIGIAALAIGALGLMPDMPSFPWLFGGMFFVGGLLPLFGGKEERVIDMAAFAPELIRRRAAAGDPVVPRNAGNRRTPAKRLAEGHRGRRRRLVTLPRTSARGAAVW